MESTTYRTSANPTNNKINTGNKTHNDVVIYLEKRFKDLEQEEQEFRNRVTQKQPVINN